MLEHNDGASFHSAGRAGQPHACEDITGKDRPRRRHLVTARTIEGIPVWDTPYVRRFEILAQLSALHANRVVPVARQEYLKI